MSRIVQAALFVLGLPTAALAQDFATEWIDRVTHEMQAERGPLDPRPLTTFASAGAAYYYDSNVFLNKNNTEHDSVFIPFVRLRLDYTEPHFDASADLLFDYKVYSRLKDSRDDEERFFGRAQYADAGYAGSLVLIVRNESDPLDAVFLDRTQRVVVDLLPKVAVDLTDVFALEAAAGIQIVRFDDSLFGDQIDNENYRADLTLVYRSPWIADVLVQGGYLAIDYTDNKDGAGNPTAPPDVDGYYFRGGLRGEVIEGLTVEGLVGYTKAESDDFKGATISAQGKDLGTADVSLRARYEATELLTVTGDYKRLIGFAGGQDPFQVINRLTALAEYKVQEDLVARARIQFDRVDSILGVDRDYFTLGGSATYRIYEYVTLDAGVTWRWGQITGAVTEQQVFKDTIIHAGLAVTY